MVAANVVVDKRALAMNGLVGRAGATRLERVEKTETGAVGHAGFEEVYAAHKTAIYSYALRMMRNEADAEDQTLATFEKALRAWERRPPDDEMRPWLFRIATNSCLDELRKRRRIQWRPWDVFISIFHHSQVATDDPEEEAIRHEKVALVRAALDRLSPRDRAALTLREYQGLSTEEVGRALGISTDGAKVALFRARERLRAAYLQLGGEFPPGRGTDPRQDSRPGSARGGREAGDLP